MKFRTVSATILAIISLVATGCGADTRALHGQATPAAPSATGAAPSGNGSAATSASASSSTSLSPATLALVPLTGDQPAMQPDYREGTYSVQFALAVLLYIQGLARAAGLPDQHFSYAVIATDANKTQCSQDNPTLTSVVQGAQVPLGIAWCPRVSAFGIVSDAVPAAGKQSNFYDVVLSVYAAGLAFTGGRDPKTGFCYHGVLQRQRVVKGDVLLIPATSSLATFYADGGLQDAERGFVEGRC